MQIGEAAKRAGISPPTIRYKQKTATTCSGLCQWIAETELSAEDVPVRRARKG